MKKPELLAPAGDLEKLKIAFIYGADAVFIGGKKFSLRARASNFDIPQIKAACDFTHNLDKKVYVTTNIIPHNENIEGLVEYLKELEGAGVDAIICAAPVIIDTAKEIRESSGINKVVLSGGSFQNSILLGKVELKLKENRFDYYSQSQLPSNDGGIALGQLAIAAKRRELGKV